MNNTCEIILKACGKEVANPRKHVDLGLYTDVSRDNTLFKCVVFVTQFFYTCVWKSELICFSYLK
jgi:hypothetical protein